MTATAQMERRAAATAAGFAPSASIAGDVSGGQIAVGDKVIQNNLGAGAIIQQLDPAIVRRPPRRRPTPVLQRPRPAETFVGRTFELELAAKTLDERRSVQFFGPKHTGKTTLLKQIANQPHESWLGGVVYYASRGCESRDDLLLAIFEFIYERDDDSRPTPPRLEALLNDTTALLVLDDVALDADELDALMAVMPSAGFVLASGAQTLWTEGEAIEVAGLDESAALALFEHRLRRPLDGSERGDVAALIQRLGGQPMQIVQMAARLRRPGVTARDLLGELGGGAAPAASGVAQLSPDDRRALAAVAAVAPVALPVEHVAAVTGVGDGRSLAALEADGLAQPNSPRYKLTVPEGALPGEAVEEARRELLAHFVEHAEANLEHPERLLEDLPAILQILRWGKDAAPHADVLRLARASDAIAAYSGRWGAWREIVEIALDAARSSANRREEAWALHQLGTRALLFEDEGEARRRLSVALAIREQIGDRVGAQATRHNMGFLPGGAPPPSEGSSSASALGWLGTALAVAALAAATALALPQKPSSGKDAARQPSVAPYVSPTAPPARGVAPGRDPDRSDAPPRPRPTPADTDEIVLVDDDEEEPTCVVDPDSCTPAVVDPRPTPPDPRPPPCRSGCAPTPPRCESESLIARIHAYAQRTSRDAQDSAGGDVETTRRVLTTAVEDLLAQLRCDDAARDLALTTLRVHIERLDVL